MCSPSYGICIHEEVMGKVGECECPATTWLLVLSRQALGPLYSEGPEIGLKTEIPLIRMDVEETEKNQTGVALKDPDD